MISFMMLILAAFAASFKNSWTKKWQKSRCILKTFKTKTCFLNSPKHDLLIVHLGFLLVRSNSGCSYLHL